MIVSNQEDLKLYAKTVLGHPMIDINIAEEQMDIAVGDSIAFFQEFYFDGITKEFMKYQITAQDKINKFITIPDTIWGVTRVFPTSNAGNHQTNIFDFEYQLRMNDLRDLSSSSMIYYQQAMQHVALIENLLNTQRQFRFNRLQGKLFLDLNWDAKINEGEYLLIEAYAALDPSTSPKMWNDRHFKHHVVALFKKQWGSNLKKYRGIALPGGITLDGQALYDEGLREQQEVEKDIMENLAPLEFIMG